MSDELDHEPLLEPEHLAELTATVMRVLDDWDVGPEDRARLLGMPFEERKRGTNRRRASAPLPQDRATLQRLSCVLSIERSVRTAFPHNAAMARFWVTTPHPLFEQQTPLEVMLRGGLEGMEQIVAYLSCTEQW